MGGFEGGDEAGFWEVDETTSIYGATKASTKTKYQIIEDNLSYRIEADGYDEMIILHPFKSEELIVEGYKTDIIFKAYKTLIDFTDDLEIIEFFHQHKVFIEVPKSQKLNEAILGALFILLAKDVCNLVLNNNELEDIAKNIGVDITPFNL